MGGDHREHHFFHRKHRVTIVVWAFASQVLARAEIYHSDDLVCTTVSPDAASIRPADRAHCTQKTSGTQGAAFCLHIGRLVRSSCPGLWRATMASQTPSSGARDRSYARADASAFPTPSSSPVATALRELVLGYGGRRTSPTRPCCPAPAIQRLAYGLRITVFRVSRFWLTSSDLRSIAVVYAVAPGRLHTFRR